MPRRGPLTFSLLNVLMHPTKVFFMEKAVISIKVVLYIIDCGVITAVLNVVYTHLNTTNTTYGSLANVTCAAGYESNVSQVMCQANTTWATAECIPEGNIYWFELIVILKWVSITVSKIL